MAQGLSKAIPYKQFRKELDKKTLCPIYLFTGEEEGEKEKVIRIIAERASPDNPSIGRFHIEDNEFFRAAEFALSPSMFVERSVCLMMNIESLQRTDENAALLREVIDNLPDSSVLIFTTTDNKVPAVIPRDLRERIKIVQFWRFFENDLFRYLERELSRNGVSVEQGVIPLLIELLGRDVRKIDGALEKLINFSDFGAVTTEVVQSLVSDERSVSIAEFLHSFFKRQKDVYYLLKKVTEDGVHDLLLLGAIMRRAESLENFHSRAVSGSSVDEILDAMNIDSRRRDDFLKYVTANPPEDLNRLFPLIYRAETRLKSSRYQTLTGNPLFDLIAEYVRW